MPFVKGQSGKPKGRRSEREIADVRAAAREWTARAIEVLGEIMLNRKAPPAARGAAAQALFNSGGATAAACRGGARRAGASPSWLKQVTADGRPVGEEVITAQTMSTPMRRGLLEKLDAELDRREGQVIEGQVVQPTT
jgi:hypothetical protein